MHCFVYLIVFQCIETLGKGYVTEMFYQELSKVLHSVLEEHGKRQNERHG